MSKKVVVIAGVALIAAIGIIVIFFVSSSSKNEIILPQELPGTTNNKKVELKTYANPTFSAQYPKDWTVNSQDRAGAIYFIARPANETDFFPQVNVSSYPIDVLENGLANNTIHMAENEKTTETTFQGLPATKITGTLKLHFVRGNPNQKPVIQTDYIVKKGDKGYIISYSYYDDENKEAFEQLFKDLISQIKLQ